MGAGSPPNVLKVLQKHDSSVTALIVFEFADNRFLTSEAIMPVEVVVICGWKSLCLICTKMKLLKLC